VNEQEREQWRAAMIRRADRLNRWTAIAFWFGAFLLAAGAISWVVSSR
jgi:hypothetical protein